MSETLSVESYVNLTMELRKIYSLTFQILNRSSSKSMLDSLQLIELNAAHSQAMKSFFDHYNFNCDQFLLIIGKYTLVLRTHFRHRMEDRLEYIYGLKAEIRL